MAWQAREGVEDDGGTGTCLDKKRDRGLQREIGGRPPQNRGT